MICALCKYTFIHSFIQCDQIFKFIALLKLCCETIFYKIIFERAFKMMNNGVYFIVIVLLVAKLIKILIYANSKCNS